MSTNYLKNADFSEAAHKMPMYYRHLGKMYYNKTRSEGARTLSFAFHRPAYEKLVYELPVAVSDDKLATVGLVIRANDCDVVKYVLHSFNERQHLIRSQSHNVAYHITSEFKEIHVRFLLDEQTSYVQVEFQFSGILTGVTLKHPSLTFSSNDEHEDQL